jgi:predicted permease
MALTTQLRFLFRRLLKTPGFAAVTLLTLAIGIGANTAIFSVVHGILLKPLPFSEADQLAGLWLSTHAFGGQDLNAAPSEYWLLNDETKTLDDVSLWQSNSDSITGSAEPEHVDSLVVTHGFLKALRATPQAGRFFTPEDDKPGSPRTVILSYAYWSRKFGASPGALGQKLRIDGELYDVIGVLRQDFQFLDENPMIVRPLQLDRNKAMVGNFSYRGIARLKPGMNFEQANADGARILPLMVERFPMPPGFTKQAFAELNLTPKFQPLKKELVSGISTLLWVLMGTIGIVLFIACANVANLLLVRAEGRQQELAVRAALGASRMDLARELLAESIALGLAGGVLGLGVAWAALRVLIANAPSGLPRVREIGLDPVVVLFALAVSLVAGILFGLIPVYKYAGPRIGTSLREGGRNASAGRERHRARAVLVVAQVALAMVLLVGAGLMIRTFQAMSKVDPGFRNPSQVLTMTISLPESQVKDDRVIPVYREMIRRLQAIPGVESAALGQNIVMDGSSNNDPLFAEDKAYTSGKLPPIRRYKYPGPGLFATMGNPVIAGREYNWTDLEQRAKVILVSEGLAKEFWGSAKAAIGKRVRENPKGTWREVIGVVGDERDEGVSAPAPKTAHWPLVIENLWNEPLDIKRWMTFVVRSPRVGQQSFADEMRNAIWSVEGELPIARTRTLAEFQRRSMARTSFTMALLAIAGGMALLLGVIGIYGVISYSVSQRTREIGIRSALGASSGEVRGMFLRHALVLAGIGIAAGFAGSVALTRWMESLLYGVSPLDGLTFGLVPLILVAAALAASYLPARRATRVDPMEALRAE